jgi:large subunit ribosomal protein L29
MKTKEKYVYTLRQKDPEALQQELSTLQRELFDLRQQSATQKIEDTSKSRRTRRNIARVKTILKQKATTK